MWQIVEYFRNNPRATATDAVDYFGRELDISNQVQFLKNEGSKISDVRQQLRPLWGEKREIEEKTKYILSDIEGDVMMEFPPRTGNEKDREAMRNKLKAAHPQWNELEEQFKSVALRIMELEHDMDEHERNGKNARRLTELYGDYIQFIMQYHSNKTSAF